jgi:predicted O-methyltransferase YrrM
MTDQTHMTEQAAAISGSGPALPRSGDPATADEWQLRLRAARRELASSIPVGTRFLLVDEDQLREALMPALFPVPFPEQFGTYWGLPEDDSAAIAELDRQRAAGLRFIVFAWPAFWWLEHYERFAAMLRSCYRCVVSSDNVIIFDISVVRSIASWKARDWLARVSDVHQFKGVLRGLVEGTRWWRRMAKLAWARDAMSERHLCEMIASVHESALPRIQLASALDQIQQVPDTTEMGAAHGGVTIHPLLRGAGSGAAAEMAALASIVNAKRPRRVLEFGTYDGCSTWHLWANTDESTEIITLDLAAGQHVEGSSDLGFQGVAHRPFLPRVGRVRLVQTDSRHWQPDVDQVDLCFIDAGHTYECVKSDTEKVLAVISPRGVILWHDATWRRSGYGVNRYLREKRRDGLDVRQLVVSNFDLCTLAILIR